LHQTELVPPATGAATTERWSTGRAKLLLSRTPPQALHRSPLLHKNAANHSHGTAFDSSAGASLSLVFTLLLSAFQKTGNTALKTRTSAGLTVRVTV